MQRNSRHYAKRQLTWFRKDKRIQWVAVDKKESPAQVALKLWKKLS
jgi:tRNA dimethylallyltransferase